MPSRPPPVPFDDRPTRIGANVLLPDIIAAFGVAPASVFAAAGLEPGCLADENATIAMSDLARLTAAAIAASGRHDIGLVVGERARTRHIGALLQRLAAERSLGSALATLVSLLPVNTRAAAIRLFVDGDEATLELSILHPFGAVAAAFDEAIIAITVYAIRELVGEAWRPLRVPLIHRPTTSAAQYRRVFGASVRCGEPISGIVLAATDLQRPLVANAAAKRAEAEAALRKAAAEIGLDFEDRVRAVIRLQLTDPGLSLAHVAEQAAMAPRSLNRRLADHGTSFAALLRQARHDVACQLLEMTQLPLGAVATAIGCGDQAVFSRAFRGWTGMSPRAWRRSR